MVGLGCSLAVLKKYQLNSARTVATHLILCCHFNFLIPKPWRFSHSPNLCQYESYKVETENYISLGYEVLNLFVSFIFNFVVKKSLICYFVTTKTFPCLKPKSWRCFHGWLCDFCFQLHFLYLLQIRAAVLTVVWWFNEEGKTYFSSCWVENPSCLMECQDEDGDLISFLFAVAPDFRMPTFCCCCLFVWYCCVSLFPLRL